MFPNAVFEARRDLCEKISPVPPNYLYGVWGQICC